MKVRNWYLDRLAIIISFFSSPFMVLSFMFLTLAWHYKMSIPQFYSYIIVVAFFVIIFPLAYLMENYKNINLLDLHVSDKEDRKKLLIVITVSVLIGYFMLSFIGMPKPLLMIELVGVINLIIITLLTVALGFNVSIHLAVVTLAATLVTFFLGDEYLLLYILLVPIAWARVYREKHSLLEVIFGVFVSFVVTLAVIQVFV